MALTYSFSGKRVLITGGASGMGRQLIQRLHDDGAVVFTVDKSVEGVEKLGKELPNVKAEIVDLADWKATRAVVDSFGKVDHLVNCAGFAIMQNFMDITEEACSLQFNVMAQATINVTQAVAKGMIESNDGGSIVNISSMGARKANIALACYSAAKAALVSLTKSMAMELGPHGIRANCILPGFTDTPLAREQIHPSVVDRLLQKLVIKRAITTNEIADLVLFLLSPLSSMITGEDIAIDGGLGI